MDRRHFCQAAVAAALGTPLIARAALPAVYAGLTTVDRDLQARTLAGGEQTLGRAAVQELADSLRGQLLLPGNAAYDRARQVLNPEIDKFPALVVQPSGTADISSAVQFARDNQLVMAVKCGGHSFSGKSTCNGGLQIDLSSFRNARIDAVRQSAYVTGGSLLGQLDHEAMARGLVTTSGTVSHTGVGGLATAGGFGRLGRRYGLTLDNIRSVDVVAGDGKLYHADADEHPDLYWGVRGGGGNFGVVANFEFQLHPMQRRVLGGGIRFPWSLARQVAEVYAEYSPQCPDELYTDLQLVMPPGGEPYAQIEVCYSGPLDDYERAIKPYLAIGTPLSNTVRAVDYVALQRSSDSSDPRAMATYMKGGFVSGISPELIAAMFDGLDGHPGRFTQLYFQHAGGAIGRVPADATAFPHRYASHNMMPVVAWPAGGDREPHVSYIKQFWEQLEPHTYGFYTVEVDQHSDRVVSRNYRDNYARLVTVKNRYDPRNLFRFNANIVPTA